MNEGRKTRQVVVFGFDFFLDGDSGGGLLVLWLDIFSLFAMSCLLDCFTRNKMNFHVDFLLFCGAVQIK